MRAQGLRPLTPRAGAAARPLTRTVLGPARARVRAVAIYHLSAKSVGRSGGRSATGAAAYRAGERITDERTGEVFDYTRKGGVESAEIVMPAGIEWQPSREQLWNAAEAAERRKDAKVAREFEVALPAELSAEERRALAREFAQEVADRYQVAADVCIHEPHRAGDERNHHAHILVTTREIEGQALGAKTRILDSPKTSGAEIAALRERWAEMQNAALERAGERTRVDHRSLEAQGIDRMPTRHLGPAAVGFERRTGEPSERRKSWQIEADASARIAAAAKAPEVHDLARQEISLSTDLTAALKERERGRAAQAVERPRPQSATSPTASRQAERTEAPGASRAPEQPRPGVLRRDLAALARQRDALVATRDERRGEAVRGAFRDQSDEWEARRAAEKAKGFLSRNREVVLYLPSGEALREALLAVERSSRQTKISAAHPEYGGHYIALADGSYLRTRTEQGEQLRQYPRAEVAEWAAEHLQAGVDRVTSARQKVLTQHQPQIDAVERQIAQERQARDRAEYLRQQQERQQRQERLRREAEQAREREIDKQLAKSLEELRHQGYDVDQPGFSAGLRAELVKQRDAAERAEEAECDRGWDPGR